MQDFSSQAERIFAEYIASNSGVDDAAIDELCSLRPELAQELRRVYEEHHKNLSILQELDEIGEPDRDANSLDRVRSVLCQLKEADADIDGYKVLQCIGEGGFGIVYMAEQTQPVERRVALKIIKPGMDTRQVLARFEGERQALAMMDHPNIARVLDAGVLKSGRPYFVMDLVRGVPITEYCQKNKLSVRDRLNLIVQVCDAVQHAHQKGIIHRDIKPSNVLVTMLDGQPQSKVIDFGIARAINRESTERTRFTELVQFVGTPEYTSPEQAQMNELDIDTRVDVYSIGVLLYELLTETQPFDLRAVAKNEYEEIRRIICTVDPQKPSSRVLEAEQSLAITVKRNSVEPKEFSRLLSGELDWIVMKALEKDRTRRYDTPMDFAADLRRYLERQPISALPPTAGYIMKKFVQRHKSSFFATILCVMAILTGAVVAAFGWLEAMDERDHAKEAENRERSAKLSAKAAADKAKASERQAVDQYSKLVILRASEAIRQNELVRARNSLALTPRSHRNWEWYYLSGCLEPATSVLRRHAEEVSAVRYSSDGRFMASGSDDGNIKIWRVGSLEEQRTMVAHDGIIWDLAFHPESHFLASVGADGHLRIWGIGDGERYHDFDLRLGGLQEVEFSADGRILAVRGSEGVTSLETAEWTRRTTYVGKFSAMDLEPSGRRLAVTSSGSIRLVEVSDGNERELAAYGNMIQTIDAAPYRRQRIRYRVALRVEGAGAESNAQVWLSLGTQTGDVTFNECTNFNPVKSTKWSTREIEAYIRDDVDFIEFGVKVFGHDPVWVDHVEIASLDGDGSRTQNYLEDFEPSSIGLSSRAWVARPRTKLKLLQQGAWSGDGCAALAFDPHGAFGYHSGELTGLQFSSDGELLISLSEKGLVRLWDVERRMLLDEFETISHTSCLSLSPEHDLMAIGSQDGFIETIDMHTGESLNTHSWEPNTIWGMDFSADGSQLIASFSDNALRIVDVEQRVGGRLPPLRYARLSPDGKAAIGLVAIGSRREGPTHEAVLWNVDEPETQVRLQAPRHAGAITVAASRQSERFAAIFRTAGANSRSCEIVVWKNYARPEIAWQQAVDDIPYTLTLAPLGNLIAYGTLSGEVVLVDISSGRENKLRLPWGVTALEFDVFNRFLIVGDRNGVIFKWPLWAGPEELSQFQAHGGMVVGVDVSSDGQFLASKSVADSKVDLKLWTLSNCEAIELKPTPPISTSEYSSLSEILYCPVEFFDQGRRLGFVASSRGNVHVYDTRSGELTLTLYPGREGPTVEIANVGTADGETLMWIGKEWNAEVFTASHGMELAERAEIQADVDAHVGRLFQEHFVSSVVIRKLLADDSLEPLFRDEAVRNASNRGDDFHALSIDSFEVSCRPSASKKEYERALAQAEAGASATQYRLEWWHVLGLAQYRTGQIEEAMASCNESIKALGGDGTPVDHAVIAMVRHKLGMKEEAQTALGLLEKQMENAPWNTMAHCVSLMEEAQSLLERE